MLTPSELERIPIEIELIMSRLGLNLMSDIIRRLKATGEITRTADAQIYRITQLGYPREVVDKSITQALDMSFAELDNLYKTVIENGYARSEGIYKATGKEFIPYNQNEPLKQFVDAVHRQTKGELINITNSLGFARKVGNHIAYSPIADTYNRILDLATTEIATGSFDYNTSITKAIKELTSSGIRTVYYGNTGFSHRVEVAARMAIMTGVAQITAKVNEMNAEKLDTNYFEVSWHSTARPTHQKWQGRVYSKEDLITICGLGDVAGLCGANCRHDYEAFVMGVSERMYTDEELEKMNEKENTPRDYLGKSYTAYEATQRQRQYERQLRRQREEIKLMEIADIDAEDILNAKSRHYATMQQYNTFSEKMELPTQRSRIFMDGIGRV